jgi:hypothetical protein
MTTNRDTALNTVYPNKGNTALGDLFCSGDITYMEFALAVIMPVDGGWMIKLGHVGLSRDTTEESSL